MLKADEYPHAGLAAEQAAAAMKVPDGFTVTVGAAEPEVKQPIAMALDDRGRVWIAEAYEYPVRAEGDKGRDRILIFEDTDGDGSLDKRKVFAEGLNLVSGLEVGFGGVWVGAAPYLMFIPDKDGDDVPDAEPQILARWLGLARHARNAERFHLGAGRLAVRLPRCVHAFASRQAGHARRGSSAVELRRLAVPSHAA